MIFLSSLTAFLVTALVTLGASNCLFVANAQSLAATPKVDALSLRDAVTVQTDYAKALSAWRAAIGAPK